MKRLLPLIIALATLIASAQDTTKHDPLLGGYFFANSVEVVCVTDSITGTGDGIWRRSLPDFVTSVSTNQVHWPLEFRLEQNYPNPFNPSTSIEFTVSQAARVSLVVFNILGERSATLVDGQLAAGTHIRTWNASEMPSGIYICQLRVGSRVASKKMILAR